MNRHLTNQPYLDSVFVPTGNAGGLLFEVARIPKPEGFHFDATDRSTVDLHDDGSVKGIRCKDPHDYAIRAAANRTYKQSRRASQAWADEWMAKHPAVYPMFVRFALEIAERRSRFSAKAIVERQRWETTVKGGADFKIPNALTAYMAKRFVKEFPQHAGLFKINKGK